MESVEELCDSIALLNKSHKILEGKVKDIRNRYRDNTFAVDFTGNLPTPDSDAPFNTVANAENDGIGKLTLKIKPEFTTNDVLGYLLPKVSIMRMEEVVPTMNEIFIQTVSKSN